MALVTSHYHFLFFYKKIRGLHNFFLLSAPSFYHVVGGALLEPLLVYLVGVNAAFPCMYVYYRLEKNKVYSLKV
jgi:hypothetical protein